MLGQRFAAHDRAHGEVPAAVLAALAQRQPATAAEIAQALGDSTKPGTKTVWQALQRLCDSGKVLKEGKQYRLPV
jgi:predicted transcriptional regulator